jgi:hypothetical protein
LCSWYPIAEIRIETANFDIQKIINPEIQGIEYQQGSLHEYQNKRAYLFSRENGRCQLCGKEFTSGNSSHMHHIIPKPKGTDRVENLALLHESCHTKLHSNGDLSKLKKNKQYKAETWMSIVRNRFQKDLPGIGITFGYITNLVRNSLGLEKTHYNDAFVIAGGLNQDRVEPIIVKQSRKNNRCLQKNRKGYAPAIRTQRYPLRPGDLVKFEGSNKIYVVKGVHNKGKSVQVLGTKKEFSPKNVSWVYHQKTLKWF